MRATRKIPKNPKRVSAPKVEAKPLLAAEVARPDSREHKLEPAQVRKAVEALIKLEAKRAAESAKGDMLEDGASIVVQVGLKHTPHEPSAKPKMLSLPYPLHGLDAGGGDPPEMCLFVKDDAKPWVKELLMEGEGKVAGLTKVISLTKLRTSYKRYEARRELLARYDLFLADDRILPMLCKTLGSTFFKPKKQPIPVRLTRSKALPAEVVRARDGTHVTLRAGTCVGVRAATTAMKPAAAAANVLAAFEQLVQLVPRKWKNVQSVSLKTPGSVALPVYNQLSWIAPRPGTKTANDHNAALAEEAKGGVPGTKRRAASDADEDEDAAAAAAIIADAADDSEEAAAIKAAQAVLRGPPSKKKAKVSGGAAPAALKAKSPMVPAENNKRQREEATKEEAEPAAPKPVPKSARKASVESAEAATKAPVSVKKEKQKAESAEAAMKAPVSVKKEKQKAAPKSAKKA